jgi:hypothetical protein
VARAAHPKTRLKPEARRRKSRGGDGAPAGEAGDVALVFGRDEHGVHVLRRRGPDAPVEAGVLHPLVEGKPITEEVIALRPRADAPLVFDVKTVLDRPTPRAAGDGPSQVASEEYRKGWDTIWGRKRAGGNADVN